MEMIDVKYCNTYLQEDLALWSYLEGFQTTMPTSELKRVALLLRDKHELKGKELEKELHKFLQRVDERYGINKWALPVLSAVGYASGEHYLIQVPSVDFYQAELDFIDSLELDEDVKKCIFAIMVLQKVEVKRLEGQGKQKDYSLMTNSDRFLGRLPRIAGIKKSRNFDISYDILNLMRDAGLLTILHSKAMSYKLLFGDKFVWEGDPLVKIADFERIGLYWDYLHGDETVGLCEICGRPYKVKKHTALQKFCDWHKNGKVEEPINIEKRCVDCGELFISSRHAALQVRCPACQRSHKTR